MKNKITQVLIYSVVLLVVLTGCAGNAAESQIENESAAYDTAVDNGLEEIEDKNYEKATAYFEIALEEDAEGEEASVLLEQTETYLEAVDLFEQEKYDEAAEQAEAVQSVKNGSETLVSKAEELSTEIEAIIAERAEKEAEEKAEAEKVESEAEAFENYKGIYAGFTGTPYESAIEYVFLISQDTVMDGVRNSGYTISEITGRSIQGDTLVLDVYTPEQAGYGESSFQHQLRLGYDDNHYKYLQMNSAGRVYPITSDDLIASGFNITVDSESPFNELKAYDKNVPRAVSRSNTELLDGYSAQQIEYARVWLNVPTTTGAGVSELNVYHKAAGSPINHYDEDSPVYPEDVIFVAGSMTADGGVTYSGNGDGTINIYEVPMHWQAPPEMWPDIYADILDTETLYLDPLADEDVVRLIQRMTIHD